MGGLAGYNLVKDKPKKKEPVFDSVQDAYKYAMFEMKCEKVVKKLRKKRYKKMMKNRPI